jgi:hypothetical protein
MNVMISCFFSVGLVLSTLSIAGEDGCPVDLTSPTPCSRQASSSLREHLDHSATKEMQRHDENDHLPKNAVAKHSAPVEDDQGEDEFNELLAHLQ